MEVQFLYVSVKNEDNIKEVFQVIKFDVIWSFYVGYI